MASTPRVLELDVLRGLSILLVLAGHTPIHPEVHSWLYSPLTWLNGVGWTGVDIFFVLSGFLVGGLLLKEYQQTGTLVPWRFWVRRGFKVWPAFYVFLSTMFAVDVAFMERGSASARAAAALAKYWPNWFHIQNYVDGHLGWLWTLALEEHFYLLLPLVLAGVLGTSAGRRRLTSAQIGRRMTSCFAAIVVTCTLLRWWSLDHGVARLFETTHLRVDSLFCGVFLAYLVRFHGGKVQRLRPWRYVILIASLSVWVPFYLDRAGNPHVLFYPWGFILLYAGASGLVLVAHLASTAPVRLAGPLRRAALWPMHWLGWLGVRSYAVYIWQGYLAQPIARRACDVLHLAGTRPGAEGWTHDFIYFAAYIGLGALMYALVELPGLRLRQRLVPAFQAAAVR
ncbi:MAG TPA: acyltransferase [Vicinamibacterales bacterium]|nr:acyltransferase [Vicinamibacterales bacterium]